MEFLKKLGTEIYQRVILSHRSTLIGMGLGAAIIAGDQVAQMLGSAHQQWTPLAAMLVTLALASLKSKKIQADAEAAKENASPPSAGFASLRLLFVLTIVLGVLAALPARASDPLVVCLSGCPQKASVGPKALAVAGDVQITPTLWFGPSVGAFFVRDGATKSWESQVQPALAYGLKVKPAWWTATASLIAIDLSVSAKFSSALTPQSIDLLPTITVMNSIGFGFGPRFHLASSPTERDAVSFLFAMSVNTALGGP